MLKLQSYPCSFVVGLLAASSLVFGSLGPPSCPFYWVVWGFFKGLVHATLQIAQRGTARAAAVEGRFLECARYSHVLRVAISAGLLPYTSPFEVAVGISEASIRTGVLALIFKLGGCSL